ncbi:YbaB/EbfC family nucleoid-associated protein [Streptomyces sp. NPDC059080]|uniref:YbaB/EbfC family nucleoid-associated protein n=1 Tax=Streptomyces sp. NPDC059080 TaxID=3346718 RepID=UPI0036A5F0E9
MSAGYQEQLNEIMGRLADHTNQLQETQQRLAQQTVKVTSKDRSITVIMGTQSDVREIKFQGEGYRSMAPAELGRALVEVLEKARLEVRSTVTRAVTPMMSFGNEARESMLGGTDQLRMMREVQQKMGLKNGPGGSRSALDDEDETDG